MSRALAFVSGGFAVSAISVLALCLPLCAQELPAQELYRRAKQSVYVVEVLHGNQVVAFGSGVAIDTNRVATNKHVIEDGLSIRVTRGRIMQWTARLEYVDELYDLCVLRVDGLSATPAQIRPLSTVAVGERVYAIGAPEGLELSLSEGLVSAIREVSGMRLLQTTAAISHGSSGGGLFDSRGLLVGITTFSLPEAQNLNFAMPAERVAGHLNGRAPFLQDTRPEEDAPLSPQMKMLIKRVNGGDVPATYELARRYDNGDEVPRDEAEAAKYYILAAEEGHSEAQLALADCYFFGRGAYKNYSWALKWYQKAAEQGVVKAQQSLGYMYAGGLGVSQDYVAAYMWYSISPTPTVITWIERRMTPEQIAEGRRRAEQWRQRQRPPAR